MTGRHLWRLVRKPIYAGINDEKWTNVWPVKCAFKGLVSVELFNRANQGRRKIQRRAQAIEIVDTVEERYSTKYSSRTNEFPYRKVVLCPICRKPLLGSASTGKSGKKYPAYHCSKDGHNFRISKQNLETAVGNYVGGLQVSPQLTREMMDKAEKILERSLVNRDSRDAALKKQIQALEADMGQVVDKLKLLINPVALKRLEQELEAIQSDIDKLQAQREALSQQKPLNLKSIRQKLEFMVEHFDQLLLY